MPGIVPIAELPLVTVPASAPVTVQVTAGFEVPATEAVMDKGWPTVTLAGLEGLVKETTTPGGEVSPKIVTPTEAWREASALLVAVMVTLAGFGTAAGAV